MAKDKTSILLDVSERLQALEEFQGLSETEKNICYKHVTMPHLNKHEVARACGIDRTQVYRFLNSKKWDAVNHEIAKQQLRELIQLAVSTLKDCLLNGTSPVKLDAAVRVLINVDLLKSPYAAKINKQDNKTIVLWNDAPAGEVIGTTDTVLTASETAGSPQLESKV